MVLFQGAVEGAVVDQAPDNDNAVLLSCICCWYCCHWFANAGALATASFCRKVLAISC